MRQIVIEAVTNDTIFYITRTAMSQIYVVYAVRCLNKIELDSFVEVHLDSFDLYTSQLS